MRVHAPGWRRGVRSGVVEAQCLAGVDGGAEGHKYLGLDLRIRPWSGAFDVGDPQRVDAVAQPRGHDLADGRQGPRSGLLDAGTGGGRRLERDGEGDGLLVVEQQRRQVRTGAEPIAAVRALRGRDRVPEFAQAVHVAADGTGADRQPLGQQRPRPVPASLQQAKQCEQSRGCLRHVASIRRRRGQFLTASAARVSV